MRCPSCNADLPDSASRCPSCGRPAVLEPELLGPDSTRRAPFGPAGFQRVFYSTFPSPALFSASGCLPMLITLTLALAALIMYGLLAAIGFLVFTAIGRMLTLILSLRPMLEGRPVRPWLLHIGTWLLCWLLVAWLSGT